jgi:hypothetical protein
VPSGSERTVPIEWDSPSEGMQSDVFDVFGGAGQGADCTVPRMIFRVEIEPRVLSGLTTSRMSWDTFAPSAAVPGEL